MGISGQSLLPRFQSLFQSPILVEHLVRWELGGAPHLALEEIADVVDLIYHFRSHHWEIHIFHLYIHGTSYHFHFEIV